MSNKTITVTKIFENPGKKDPSKVWWNVVDENNVKYAVWDATLRARLTEGYPTVIEYTTNEQGYHAIKEVGATNIQNNLSHDEAPLPRHTATEIPVVAAIVNERMHAMDAAIAIAPILEVSDWIQLESMSNQILSYYYATTPRPATNAAPASTEAPINVDDFLRAE